MTTNMLGLRHLALRVADIRRALDFYTKILGMRVDWQPDERNVYLTTGSDNLALHEIDSPVEIRPQGGAGLDHFGLVVSNPESVDEWAARLTAAGVALEHPPRTHRDGSRSLYFCDPDGHLVQLLFHPHISDP